MCTCVWVCLSVEVKSLLSPSTIWVSGMELSSPGLGTALLSNVTLSSYTCDLALGEARWHVQAQSL